MADTNVPISAQISVGNPSVLVERWLYGEGLMFVTCPTLIEEADEVFHRPKLHRLMSEERIRSPGGPTTGDRSQAIKPAVVNRKVWGDNRTWRGATTQGRIMSALRTAVQQGIDPIALLVRVARSPDAATVSLFA